MEYRFKCDVKAGDLWKMAMARTYRSLIGLVNVIFTVAMILLTIRFWPTASDLLRVLMVFGCILFPVIQPLAIYGNSVKQLEDLPKDLELLFNDGGVTVFACDKSESLAWKRIKNAMEKCKKEKNKSDVRDFTLLIAQIRVMEGRHSEALKVYEELVKEEPKDFRPYLCQGIIYTLLRKKDEAEKQFDKFRRLVPRNHPYREYFVDNMVATKIFGEKVERESMGSKS